jgi:hypothetical protein
VEITEVPLNVEIKDGWLCETVDPSGKPTRVVTSVDGGKFSELWLNTVTGKNTATPDHHV